MTTATHAWRLALLVCAGWLLAPWAHGQEQFTVKRDVALREAPRADAKSTPLPANAVVTRLDERQGPFRRVRTSDGKTGWLHMFDLQSGAQATPAAAPSTGTSALRSLGQAFGAGGTRPTTVATSTVGIRGLDADDLANATPNLAAVDAAGQHKVSESQARQFAQRAGLRPREVADLNPAPPSSAPGAGTLAQ